MRHCTLGVVDICGHCHRAEHDKARQAGVAPPAYQRSRSISTRQDFACHNCFTEMLFSQYQADVKSGCPLYFKCRHCKEPSFVQVVLRKRQKNSPTMCSGVTRFTTIPACEACGLEWAQGRNSLVKDF
jgi:hypothetical protein